MASQIVKRVLRSRAREIFSNVPNPNSARVFPIIHRPFSSSSSLITATLFPGDGIGPEIVESVKQKIILLLRDGRKMLGILRSFDQFVLEGASERVIVGDLYCDIPLGLYVFRGENVVLLGELELEKEELPQQMIRVSAAEIERAQKEEKDASDLKGTMRKRMEFLDFN